MAYATLLVYVNADCPSKPLVSVAASLANKMAARLIGVSALAIVPPFVTDGVVIVDQVTDADIATMKAKLTEAGEQFRSAAAHCERQEWRSAIDFPTQTLIGEARSADLVLIEAATLSADVYRTIDVGSAILGAGRPFLVVPPTVKSFVAHHVLIGWKDTREARRAVQDALPFLHEAERVTVMQICHEDEMHAAGQQVADVVRYLAEHRIKAEPRVEIHAHGSGANQLIQRAEWEKADLLVLGAYGHSRLRELIFGGMTRDLLTACPICCLMSN